MFILYHKELYIVKEPLAMCDSKEELEKYRLTMKRPDDYYIEEQPKRD